MDYKTQTVIDDLIGKVIRSVAVGEVDLVFKTDDGEISVSVHGDCCSESWWADITGVASILGQEITAVRECPLLATYNVNDGRGRQEEDQAYGFQLATVRGFADFIFRNSSNGYYGGWMDSNSSGPQQPASLVVIDDEFHATAQG